MTREEAIKMLTYNSNVIHQTINGKTDPKEVEALDMAIKALEHSDRLVGHWIDTDNYYQRWKCSECGCHTRDAEPNFCPNCGAEMDGEE